ncbi:MAG TPA: DinB family protein [Pyrinomonadaceae bacterium]|nr:DinB family protein [Pyrinomonadaceae bacterium]
MSTNQTNGVQGKLIEQLGSITEDARKVFGALTPAQLNWKPSAEEWSVGQCFDHLIVTNRGFFPLLEQVGRGERRNGAWENWSPFTGLFGKFVARSLEQEGGRKFKAPKKLEPSSSDIDGGIINRFAEHQSELSELLKATAGRDLEKVVVTSPISGFVTYRLPDACRIVVAHERRHFAQARRVTEAVGFPSSKS